MRRNVKLEHLVTTGITEGNTAEKTKKDVE